MINREVLEKTLKTVGYKLTNQRKAILDVLFEHQEHFLSAEEIYIETNNKFTQTNFSTIYRNLEIFVKLDLIHKINIKDEASSYGLICSDFHHHHIICRGCGKTEVLDFCPMDEIKKKSKHRGFTFTDHRLELYGYCIKCQTLDPISK